MRDKYILTAESVTEGHPDKLCDTIADSVLDACLKGDSSAHVACEVLATAGKVLVAGEISAKIMPDIPSIVCRTIREAGYTGLNYEIEVITHNQSDDIAHAVREGVQTGAGDQGIVYGFACDETESYLPLPVILAHRLTRLLTNARKTGMIQGLRPDGKAQVSVEYSFDTKEERTVSRRSYRRRPRWCGESTAGTWRAAVRARSRENLPKMGSPPQRVSKHGPIRSCITSSPTKSM